MHVKKLDKIDRQCTAVPAPDFLRTQRYREDPQCKRYACYLVDGKHYCREHASLLALDHLAT